MMWNYILAFAIIGLVAMALIWSAALIYLAWKDDRR